MMMPQMIPIMLRMSRTAPIRIKILAQFLPDSRASAKNSVSKPKMSTMNPKGPNTNPDPRVMSEPTICSAARMVTPVGLRNVIVAGGATDTPVVGIMMRDEKGLPQFGQNAAP